MSFLTQEVEINSVSVEKRWEKSENTSIQVMEAIAMYPTMNAKTVDVLLDNFNLNSDVVALVKVKKTLSKQKAP